MSEVRVSVQAPSNIALVKYMGKKNSEKNLPANPSISMTLNSLCTFAEIALTSRSTQSEYQWVSELPQVCGGFSEKLGRDNFLQPAVPNLKERDLSRVTRHIDRVRNSVPEIFRRFELEPRDTTRFQWSFKTANTFPASSGIASSASSFAAITLAAAAVSAKDPVQFDSLWKGHGNGGVSFRRALAQISRQGSGSSCRSFEGPWVYWEDEEASCLDSRAMPEMAHFVVLIKTEPKKVSSSEAHSRILSSPLWNGRVERVLERTHQLKEALRKGDMKVISRISWTEAWEMHSLFHTSSEPFSYWEPGTLDGLQWLGEYIREECPPIVTLDAGPNIHVLVDRQQQGLWRQRLKEHFPNLVVLEDRQGNGASVLAGAELVSGVNQ